MDFETAITRLARAGFEVEVLSTGEFLSVTDPDTNGVLHLKLDEDTVDSSSVNLILKYANCDEFGYREYDEKLF